MKADSVLVGLVVAFFAAVSGTQAQQGPASPPAPAPTLAPEEWGAPPVTVSQSGTTWTIASQKNPVTLNASDLFTSIQASGGATWKMVPSSVLSNDAQQQPGAQPQAPAAAAPDTTTLMKSAMFTWEALTATPTNVGAVRRVVRAPTATLDEFESHITTLNVGQQSHPPHQHPNEEVIILKEGTCEAFINGAWTSMPTGSMVFFASNQLHAIRNAGSTPATYYVINWASPGMLKQK